MLLNVVCLLRVNCIHEQDIGAERWNVFDARKRIAWVGLWGSRRIARLPGHNSRRCDGSIAQFVYVTAVQCRRPRSEFADLAGADLKVGLYEQR